MSSREARTMQLSAQTLKIVDKYLPENNDEQPDGYPISFTEFCAFTNVREVTINAIKQSHRKLYKMYLKNENCIRAQEYNFYVKFYKSPEARIYSPYCDIIVNSTCSKEQCELVMSYPKNVPLAQNFPVTFETFCKYTNYDEIVDKAVKSLKLKIDKNSSEWEKYARKLYREFYTSKEKRKKFNIRIKPCTKTFKDKLLKYAEDGENLGTEFPKRPQCVDTLKEQEEQPAPKRQRLIPEVDAQTNVEEFNAHKFPVSYDTFLMHTNVKDLAERYLNNNSDALSNSFDVVELTKKLYVEFYTRPRYENALFNELFVRQNYAHIITSFSDAQMSTDANESESRQNEVAGTWCTKMPKTNEFAQKYLNTNNDDDAYMYNNNSTNCSCRNANANVGNKEKVVIQSVEIIKPSSVALHTISPTDLNESEPNRLDPAEPQLSRTNNNIEGTQTFLPENIQPNESEETRDREQDHDVSEEQITETTHSDMDKSKNDETYQSNQSTELSENDKIQETESLESNDGLQFDHRELIESDQVTQDEPLEITLKKGSSKTFAHNESVENLSNSSAQIEMRTQKMPDQNLNVVENESIHDDRELEIEQNHTMTGREANENSQLEADNDQRLTELYITERRASINVFGSIEAEPKTNICQSSSTRIDHKISEMSWHYPISFAHFCKYAKLQDVVESIRKKRTEQNGSESSETTWMNIAREVYENFYTNAEKRQEYAISFKPLPDVKRKKIFEFASKVENKVQEKTAEESNQTDCNKSESATLLPSNAKPCEETLLKKEQKSEAEIEDTKDDILSAVERALKALFEENDMETTEVEEEEEAPKSTTSAEKSYTSMSSKSNESHQQVISDERCIDVYQKQTTNSKDPSFTDSAQRDFLRRFSQLQSESLFRPSDLCNSSPILEDTMTVDNFIDMPNTQQQCDSLSEDDTNILPQPDPLKETILNNDSQQQQNQNNRQSLSRILPEEAPSTKNESLTDLDAKSKELINKKVFPLKNLKFELNSDDNFEVNDLVEEPVLLNDSQDTATFVFGTGRDILRVLVKRLPSVANLVTQEDADETFMCPEAQRLPSTLSFEANHQAASTFPEEITAASTLPEEITAAPALPEEITAAPTLPEEITVAPTLPEEIEAAPKPISEDVEHTNIPSAEFQPQKPQNENTNSESAKQKKAHYRVVKSKNFAYEVPQILHALRPLPVTAVVPGQKQSNGTVSTTNSAK